MKTGILILAFVSLAYACGEKEADTPSEVKYEVITTAGTWFGEYISETGEKIGFFYPPWPESGWTYSFTVMNKPFTLHIDASFADCTGCPDTMGTPDVTSNIYVDNQLVATNTSNWAPGVSSADFVIK